eukprot:NODE_152_length_15391_cov_0.883272.p7 type:complete len:244 gc:universal NODE_152_length_15391_cov_0.883272:4693-5424(+)
MLLILMMMFAVPMKDEPDDSVFTEKNVAPPNDGDEWGPLSEEDQIVQLGKTVIFDLDYTLVRSKITFVEDRNNANRIFVIRLIDGKYTKLWYDVQIRPYAIDLLKTVKNLGFNVGIFTASEQDYADEIIKLLDPDNDIITQRLYRDSCIPVYNDEISTKVDYYMKDLTKVKGDLDNMVLVDDDDRVVFKGQNHIPVNSYFGENGDHELRQVGVLLNEIARSKEESISETLAELWARRERSNTI